MSLDTLAIGSSTEDVLEPLFVEHRLALAHRNRLVEQMRARVIPSLDGNGLRRSHVDA